MFLLLDECARLQVEEQKGLEDRTHCETMHILATNSKSLPSIRIGGEPLTGDGGALPLPLSLSVPLGLPLPLPVPLPVLVPLPVIVPLPVLVPSPEDCC